MEYHDDSIGRALAVTFASVHADVRECWARPFGTVLDYEQPEPPALPGLLPRDGGGHDDARELDRGVQASQYVRVTAQLSCPPAYARPHHYEPPRSDWQRRYDSVSHAIAEGILDRGMECKTLRPEAKPATVRTSGYVLFRRRTGLPDAVWEKMCAHVRSTWERRAEAEGAEIVPPAILEAEWLISYLPQKRSQPELIPLQGASDVYSYAATVSGVRLTEIARVYGVGREEDMPDAVLREKLLASLQARAC
jgi:hypothetical protein